MQRRSFIKNTIVTSTGMMLFPSFAKTGFAEEEKSLSEVEKYFINPPLSARPWCFWMWINGNITKEGIRIGFYYSQAQDWNHPGGAVSWAKDTTTLSLVLIGI